jgi:hypothetical protein
MDRIAVAEWPISKFHLAAAAVSFFYLPLISFLLLYILLIFGFWKERLVYNKWDLTRRWCVPAMRRMWIFSTLHSPATKLFFFFRTLELNLCCVYIPSDALFLLFSLSAGTRWCQHTESRCARTIFWTVAKALSSLTYSCIYRPRWMGTQLHT